MSYFTQDNIGYYASGDTVEETLADIIEEIDEDSHIIDTLRELDFDPEGDNVAEAFRFLYQHTEDGLVWCSQYPNKVILLHDMEADNESDD